MSEQIGEAVINVRTDGSKATAELGKIGDQGGAALSGGLAGAAKKAAGLAAGAFAGAGVAKFFQTAVGGASDLQESLSKTNVVFGEGANAVVEYSKQGAGALGQTQNDVLAAASTFGTFGKAAGLGGKDLAKFSTDFTGLATDMASFHNSSPEEAVTAIGAALRGESEPIRRFGVLLDDASLRNEALKQGLIATTSEALTPQQKTLAASALIMKQTSDAQGDFERTSGGLANSQRILSATVSDLATQAGTFLLPAVTSVVQGITGLITGFQSGSGAGGVLRDVFTTLAGAVQTVYGWLEPVIGFLANNLEAVGAFAAVLLTAAAATAIWSAAVGILNAVLAINPITIVVLAIAALVAILVLAYQHSETFRTIVQTAFAVVSTAASALWAAVQIAFNAIVGAIRAVIGWVQDLPEKWQTMIGTVIGNVAEFVTGLVAKFLNLQVQIAQKVSGLVGDVVGFFAGLPGSVLSAIGDIAGSIWGKFSGVPSKISGLITDIVGYFTGLPGKIVTELGDLGTTIGDKFVAIGTAAAKIPGDIVGYFTGLAGKILNAIGSIDLGSLIKWPDDIPGVPGLARGTDNWPGGLAVVGEHGTELVNLPRGSQVTPADETARMLRDAVRGGSGSGAVINVMLPTGDPEAAAMAVMNRLARVV